MINWPISKKKRKRKEWDNISILKICDIYCVRRSNNHDYKAPTKGFAFFWECHLGSEEFSDEI